MLKYILALALPWGNMAGGAKETKGMDSVVVKGDGEVELPSDLTTSLAG